jgi:hypothetical protein
MENVFFVAGFISAVYFIVKFIEMRFVEKESKPLKLLIRDSLLVYFSVIFGSFILDQLKPMIQDAEVGTSAPAVFTGDPAF